MSLDLFFSQPVAQNPSTGIPSDKIGPSGSNRSDGIQSFPESPEGDHDNFLSTLKQVAQDQNPARRPDPAAESRLTKPTAAVAGGKIDDVSDHETSPVDTAAPTEPDEQPDPMATEWNLAAFIKLLERMGFNHATDPPDLPNIADVNPADADLISAIESLIARLQQDQIGLTADLKSGLEQLQQFITTALRTGDGVSGPGLNPSQISELVQIKQLLNGLTAGIRAQTANSDLLLGAVKASSAIAAEAEGSAGTALKSPVINDGPSGPASIQSVEQSAVRSQPENRSDADPKSSTDSQPLAAKNDPDAKAAQAVETAAAEASKTKAPLGAGREPQHTDRSEVPGRIATASDRNQTGIPDAASVKPNASSGPDPAVVKMSESQNQSAAGAEPLSKVFQETQLAKEGGVKAASGATEETAAKVIKTEAGTNDSGLLNSSGQNLQKAAEPAAVQKDTEAGQNGLRNQTLDQIVRKGAILHRNGQHEAQIELKPDFLGHIRMQVISANHQVTVKILAEHGFVKDMIESNIHQLKADLQQQGLEVDKLEVTVSRDAQDSGNDKEKFAQSKARPNNGNRQNEDSPAKEKKRQTAASVRTPVGAATVDYFA